MLDVVFLKLISLHLKRYLYTAARDYTFSFGWGLPSNILNGWRTRYVVVSGAVISFVQHATNVNTIENAELQMGSMIISNVDVLARTSTERSKWCKWSNAKPELRYCSFICTAHELIDVRLRILLSSGAILSTKRNNILFTIGCGPLAFLIHSLSTFTYLWHYKLSSVELNVMSFVERLFLSLWYTRLVSFFRGSFQLNL